MKIFRLQACREKKSCTKHEDIADPEVGSSESGLLNMVMHVELNSIVSGLIDAGDGLDVELGTYTKFFDRVDVYIDLDLDGPCTCEYACLFNTIAEYI